MLSWLKEKGVDFQGQYESLLHIIVIPYMYGQ